MPSGKALNRYGAVYTNGRPLPVEKRKKVVELAEEGSRVVDIAKELKITHGCVSKILSRYRSTGSAEPCAIGGSLPTIATPKVIEKIRSYKEKDPNIIARDIQARLLKQKVCDSITVPSISTINRTAPLSFCGGTRWFRSAGFYYLLPGWQWRYRRTGSSGVTSTPCACDWSTVEFEEMVRLKDDDLTRRVTIMSAKPRSSVPVSSNTAEKKHRNKSRGGYKIGQALPDQKRRKIVELAEKGMGVSRIAVQLKISHGCVSKILARYRITGSAEPGPQGGSEPTVSTPKVVEKIKDYKQEDSEIIARDIRERLIKEKVCTSNTVPSISSINRIARRRKGEEICLDSTTIMSTTQTPSSSKTKGSLTVKLKVAPKKKKIGDTITYVKRE